MKVLVIGSGGREHALAWRLGQCPCVEKVFATPGNPGTAQIAECVPGSVPEDYLAIAKAYGIDLTVVGPELPLVAGVVDLFLAAGLQVVGPTAAAAQLEGSKSFSKQFMIRAGIPTARFLVAATPEEARSALDRFGFPVVLKTDGLAAGKGVIIAEDRSQAEGAIASLMSGSRLVIEEFLQGEEVSFIVLSDGQRFVPFQPTQDHKAAFDGDKGPNTGGMGAYCDSRILTERQTREIASRIIEPAIERMAAERNPFTGFLYAGLMMTSEGPKVLEFNARLGDPETQALMVRTGPGLADVLAAAARGNLAGARLDWKPDPSVCVVLAAHGYPGQVRTGDAIQGIAEAEGTGATVFQAGTKAGSQGLETAGGRVLGVTGSGSDAAVAIHSTYAAVEKIYFDGMHYRSDIGAKGQKRYNEEYLGT